MQNENLLRNIFIILMIFLFLLIISTPILVSRGTASFLDEKTKEIVEAGMLFVLVAIGFAIYFLYKRRLEQKEKQLNEILNYVGAINLQVDQIKSITDTLTRYPESKKDFKYLFESIAERALAAVNGDWVLFRIVDVDSGKTLTEYAKARGAAVLLKFEVSNKELLGNKNPADCRIVASIQENLRIRVFCVMPVEFLDKNQEVLLKAIVNNLSMLYIIFTSKAVRKQK